MLPSAGGTTAPPGGTSPANPKPFSRARFVGEIGCRVAACCCWIVCLKSSTVAAFGGCTRAPAVGAVAEVALRFPLPVSHMMSTITTATPRITSCWVFFGSSPAGFGALFSTVPRNCVLLWVSGTLSSGIEFSWRILVCGSLHSAFETQFLVAQSEIALVHNLWNHVHAVS